MDRKLFRDQGLMEIEKEVKKNMAMINFNDFPFLDNVTNEESNISTNGRIKRNRE